MTVKERTGRKRYVHFSHPASDSIRKLVRLLDDSRIVHYHGIVAMRIKHTQLPYLKELAVNNGIRIDRVSGTLKSLRKKLSDIK
ncbi:MAG: hypothetical protein M1123_03110 [Candidatus Thermoplasmatota archaeon]|jgi:mRNA degradation ribonuclease J1/J2|nr:hypothetical protein [Candidatus Thermoplasmatota archaeon]